MGYVTSVELFMDLKPRIYEVCTMYRLVGDMIFQSKNHSKSLAISTLVWSWRNIPTSFQFMGLFFPPQRMS